MTWTGRPPIDQPRPPPATRPPPASRHQPAATRRLPERATDNGTGPAPAYDRRVPADQLLPDLALYEQLIGDGTAAADAQDCPVDHVTARRLAIWLAARPQHPSFAQGLARFINTGAISPTSRTSSASTPAPPPTPTTPRPPGSCATPSPAAPTSARSATNFGAACHQLDRSDLMLAELRDRTWHGTSRRTRPGPADTDGPRDHRPGPPRPRQPDRHLRPGRRHRQHRHLRHHRPRPRTRSPPPRNPAPRQALPEGSYGRRNRQAIADRETRITTRLRAIEHAYQTAIEHGQRTQATRAAEALRPGSPPPGDDRPGGRAVNRGTPTAAPRGSGEAPLMAARSAQGARWDLDLLTPDDVCALLKVKKSWLYDTVENGAIEVIRLGKQLRFRPSALIRYLDDRATNPNVTQHSIISAIP